MKGPTITVLGVLGLGGLVVAGCGDDASDASGETTVPTTLEVGLAPAELDRLNEMWGEGMDTWAALSSTSTVVTVTDTGHNIQLEHPDVVVEEVAKLRETTQ